MVLGEVQAVLLHALDGHAWSHGLGKPVDVEHLVVELALELGAEVVREGLGAMDACPQVKVTRRVHAHLDGGVGDVHRIARRAADDGGTHLLEHANLTLGVARAHGNGGAAGGDAAVVSAETPREEAVAIAHVADVIGAAVHVLDAAGEALAPDPEVALGVGTHGGHACGAGRHVNLPDVAHRHGEHAVRIRITEVLLGDEGSPAQVIEGLDGVGVKARLVKAPLVERDVLVAGHYRPLEPIELHLLDLLVRHPKHFLLIGHANPSLPAVDAA